MPRSRYAVTGICNRYCDARDPALSPDDPQPVSAAIYSRAIVLHLDDAEAEGWGSIGNGRPGDEVWLDRSFDGARTWASGSRLGDTTIPTGAGGWRTLMPAGWRPHGRSRRCHESDGGS